jgi:pimeloyl-ACP methyl ester carboxylesterase
MSTEPRCFDDMNARTLYAKVLGESHPETIVFIAGFVGSHEVWNKDFRSLSSKYRLVLIDTPGFGRSPITTAVEE